MKRTIVTVTFLLTLLLVVCVAGTASACIPDKINPPYTVYLQPNQTATVTVNQVAQHASDCTDNSADLKIRHVLDGYEGDGSVASVSLDGDSVSITGVGQGSTQAVVGVFCLVDNVSIGCPININVSLPLTFTPSPTFDIPASTVGTPITPIDVSTGVSGGTPPYSYSAWGLPAGIEINSDTGIISGTPTTAGAAGLANITVRDDAGASKDITINYGAISVPPIITTESRLLSGQVGRPYTATLQATGTTPITWEVEGLPDGLTVDPSTGVISGTPSAAGDYRSIGIRAENSVGYDAGVFTLTIYPAPTPAPGAPQITTTALPEGNVGITYGAQLTATSTTPITWSAVNLPDGLTLDPDTGLISGKPTVRGDYDVTVTVKNFTSTDTKVFPLVIGAPVLAGIDIDQPDKTTYTVGESLDLTGLVVRAVYSDHSSAVIPNTEYTINPVNGTILNTVGQVNVNVSCQGENMGFSVTVNEAPVTLTNISIDSPPDKTTYTVGDMLDLSGLAVMAHYSNGNSAVITEYSISHTSGTTLDNVGTLQVTVIYQGMEASIYITVNEETTTDPPIDPPTDPTPTSKPVRESSATRKPYAKAAIGNCREWVNVRSGPGTEYAVIGKAYLGETIELIEWDKTGTWCRVIYNGGNNAGWVYGKYIIAK